jgi:small acid-soluble spore protein D (minor alpha/beta-type SASP)
VEEVNGLARKNPMVSNARSALDQMKYEVASEVGVNLKQGYNGDLTTRENGTVGGYMVKRMFDQYYQKNGGNSTDQ